MSTRLSNQDADTLRAWFNLSAASYRASIGLRMPHRPLQMMVLVYLTLQSEGETTFKELRAACKIESSTSLTNAIDSLKSASLVMKIPGGSTRERRVRLTDGGRNVVGNFLKARHLES